MLTGFLWRNLKERNRSLEKPRRRWEIGLEDVIWIGPTGGLFVNTVMNLRVPKNTVNFLTT
jgi:hypothetical protein